MICASPGCTNQTLPGHAYCLPCTSRLGGIMVHPVPAETRLFACDESLPDIGEAPPLEEDIIAVTSWLIQHAQADAQTLAHRETTIRRLQHKLDLRGRFIHRLTDQRDHEAARADGLERQIAGLRAQITALQAELDQIYDLAAMNGKKTGLAVVDTTPGDYRPEYAGYNVLWAKIDPDTLREICWRWFRV
jgi:hypothetical protein